jgi:hypothetical protein
MMIRTRLTEKDFVKVTFAISFSKPMIRVVFIIMGICLILAIVSAIAPMTIVGDFSIFRLIFPLFVLVSLPAITYFAAKKNYLSNKRMQELVEYKFEKNYLIIQGESFDSQMTWDKIYKVSQTKKWIFIWQSKQSANVIRTSDISVGEKNELKQILNAHHVKNNIK